ncbi:MAG TPA: glucan biosynthesis protein, partial [Burkholderiales bacterium]|nr:glucan biosynthesis protein [Burkholderiales bacterium]
MHPQLQQQSEAPGAMPNKIVAAAAVSLLLIALPGAAAEPRVTFAFEQVVEIARQLSQSPARRLGAITPGLEKLSYDQYRELRFRTQKAFWGDVASPFRIDLLPAGFVFQTPVAVSLVEDGRVTDLRSDSTLWDVGDKVPAHLHDVPLSLSGFRVRTRLNSRSIWDEFLVFQGASYFRAVGRGQLYGLSARGLALRTGEPQGEEFPAFTHFWIERPTRFAGALTIYALLESASLTGAYRFVASPGRDTVMEVQCTLFPRADVAVVGIAPLTSMFMFNASNRSRFDDFRESVHDSDGLFILASYGEAIWRPLTNPRELQAGSFTYSAPSVFGLMQRARLQAEYQDLEASYERRPSAWVEPLGNWGNGPIRLLEIPTTRETNDNIVAFWQPRGGLRAGQPFRIAYRLHWSTDPEPRNGVGRIVATRIGNTFDGKRRLFVIDIEGAGMSSEGLKLSLSSSAGKIANPVIQPNPVINGLRASFEFDTN